ncbi:MAG TPA: class 1 fructose-bisphosphatase [Pyrinomonadaceae bacterium]|jgi:fructose-1,6-bisphosphatase I|nr:class 1 fructose-bisphosphatase [Pyrinomonadaceae bacterium]
MVTTFQQHIVQEQTRFPGESFEIQWLLSGIILATKMIQAQVRRAGLVDILGSLDNRNIQGEVQQKLDVYANDTLINCFSRRASVGIIASEENEHPMAVGHTSPDARYAIVFDPLDGSSNIDVAVTIGTTFSIFRRPDDGNDGDPLEWVLQPGNKQIAAGYVVYGSSTVLVYSVGNGVHGFTLDPSIGSYILTHENIRMPAQGKYYSINEAYCDKFPAVYCEYLKRLKSGDLGHFYSSRFIGSMVADFHRTLLQGGIFLYPENTDNPTGRLRLLYEANPVAFIAEQAGGTATDGKQRILDIQPHNIHQRTPLMVGGKIEMEELERCLKAKEAKTFSSINRISRN